MKPVLPQLVQTLAKCVGSTHFQVRAGRVFFVNAARVSSFCCSRCHPPAPAPCQVAERALFLWNSEALINGGVLSRDFAAAVLPAVYSPLQVKDSILLSLLLLPCSQYATREGSRRIYPPPSLPLCRRTPMVTGTQPSRRSHR